MARLARLLGRGDQKDSEEETKWLVGGRYEVLQSATLHSRPDLHSKEWGRVHPRETVLMLAMMAVPADQVPSDDSTAASNGEVLLAFLANTKPQTWAFGWAQIAGPPLQEGDKVLRRRRLRGSWQVGGRYRVLGNPVLRSGIELESPQVAELSALEAEVLVLDLGLLLKDGQPRLRGYVWTDTKTLGWLTIEGAGASPLLEPVNLFSEDAVLAPGVSGIIKHRRSGSKANGRGQEHSLWQAGGKYRAVAKVQLYESPELDSKPVGSVKKGTLVLVQQTSFVKRPHGDTQVRLQVAVPDSHSHYKTAGWLSPLNSSTAELVIDFRDHLEFHKILSSSKAVWDAAGGDDDGTAEGTIPSPEAVSWSNPYRVEVDRSNTDSVGLVVDHGDGTALLIDEVNEGPFSLWNEAHPVDAVHAGDRIICVNGKSGDTAEMLKELTTPQKLEVVLQRPLDLSPKGNGVEDFAVQGRGQDAKDKRAAQQDDALDAFALPVLEEYFISTPGLFQYGGSSCSGHNPAAKEPTIEIAQQGQATATFGARSSRSRGNESRCSGSPPATLDNPPGTPKAATHALSVENPGRGRWPDQGCNGQLSGFVASTHGGYQSCDDPVDHARTHGVARPLFNIDEGPETRPFADASLEPEAPLLNCPCRGERDAAGPAYFLGCGGSQDLSAGGGYFRQLVDRAARIGGP